ncbi:DUF4258 domain-containing protein [Patescibacteria group bacterium]|nr:DUF4258 domain-containing protein [Patescibacteria group bacterium]
MIIFTNHALLKLRQRGISKAAAIESLKSPTYRIPSYSNRMIAYKKFDKLYLKVIYKVENGDIVVITQHWEERPKLVK